MPKSLYRTARGNDPAPIRMNPRVTLVTSEQVRGWVLCASCEERLNRCGEQWTLRRLWRSPTDFKLLEALRAETPFRQVGDYSIYRCQNAPGVDIDSLTYFCASLFWRASVDGWRSGSRVALGPHSESLRLFLLGSTSFPVQLALHFAVCTNPNAAFNRMFSTPGPCSRDGTPERYFVVDLPGARAVLVTSRHLPPSVTRVCMARTGYILACEDLGAWRQDSARRAREVTTLKGKLADDPNWQ